MILATTASPPVRRLAAAAILAVFAGTMPSAQVPIPIDPEAGPFPWAIPLDGGPIDVLLAAPLYTIRDAANLSQFMDLDIETQPWDAELDEHGAATAVDDSIRVAALDGSVDVIVFANLGPIPPSELIRSHIDGLRAGGTGSVLVRFASGTRDWAEALAKNLEPLESNGLVVSGIGDVLAPNTAESVDFVSLYEDPGGARFVDIAWPAPAPESHCLVPLASGVPQLAAAHLPSQLSLVAKAIRWAAHREPAIRIASIVQRAGRGPDEAEIPPFLPREFIEHSRGALGPAAMESFIVQLDGPTPSRMEVRFQLRYPDRDTIGLARGSLQEAIPRGASAHEIQIPSGPGNVLLDVWLLERNRVVDWYTAAIAVNAWPELDDPQCEATMIERNGELRLTARIRPNLNLPRPATLYARATDALGRRVAEKYAPIPDTGGDVAMALRLSDLVSTEVLVELFACDIEAGKISPWTLERSSYAAFRLPIRQPPGGAFAFVARGLAGYEPNARTLNRAARKLGVDALAALPGTVADVGGAADGLHPIARVAAFDDPASEGPACLSDPAMLRDQRFSVADIADMFAPYGAGLYSLGDGSRIAPDHDARCDSPACDEAFRTALETAYPALDALNAAWGSDFASWHDIDFANAPEGSLPARVDRQQYLANVFGAALTQTQFMLHGVEMGARAGFAAVHRPDAVAGYHWAELVPRLGMISVPAGSPSIAKIRSYTGPETFHTVSLDGEAATATPGLARWAAWDAALEGMRGIRIEGAYGAASYVPAVPGMNYANVPAEWFGEAATAVAEIRSGFDVVFSRSRRENSGIAILDSYTSNVINEIDHSFGCTSTEAEAAFTAWIQQLGFQYAFVSEDRLDPSLLDDYRVVVLPTARALGEAAIAALLKFQANGGALLADVAPAQFDEHGVVRAYPPLAGAFGVRHRKPIEAGVTIDLDGSEAVPDISLVVDAAVGDRSAGDIPLWVRHNGEKDRALLLNHTINLGIPSEESGKVLREWLMASGARLAANDVLDDWSAPETRCVRFDYGAANIVAFSRRPDAAARTARLSVSPVKGRFEYDMRAALPLGSGRRHAWPLDRGNTILVASLPYEVSRVTIEAPVSIVAGRRLPIHLGVKSRESLPGTHAVHVTIAPRFGPPLAHYSRTVECPGGQGELYIPLALNEATGRYIITARDVLTGIESTHMVEILPGV